MPLPPLADKIRIAVVLFLFASTTHLNAQQYPQTFHYHQKLIFLRMKVEHKDSLLFLMDTGANTSAIDSETAEMLKLSAFQRDTVEGTMGKMLAPSVWANVRHRGSDSAKKLSLTTYSLKGAPAPPGQKLDGILGTDYLKQFAITIDFELLQIHFNWLADTSSLVVLPFFMDNGIPAITAKIGHEIAVAFRYDSGSSLFETDEIFINTTTAVFRQLVAADSLLKPALTLTGSGIGGAANLFAYKLDSVVLGSIVIADPFIIVQPEAGYFARKDAIGFFGNNLMEKFPQISIDFPNRKMFLKPRNSSNHRIYFN